MNVAATKRPVIKETMRIGGKKAQRAKVLDRHAVANRGDGVEQLAFTGAGAARRRTRQQRQAARVGEVNRFGEQPRTTRKLLINELQVQRTAEGGESLRGGTGASTITRGEAAADLALYKGGDNEQGARPLVGSSLEQFNLLADATRAARHPGQLPPGALPPADQGRGGDCDGTVQVAGAYAVLCCAE